MSYVYVLSDKKGLYYVGKSVDINHRIINHRNDIKIQGTCSSRVLDIDFECEILEEYSNEWDLLKGEQKWYDIYKKEHGDKLVNKCRPLNTVEEYRIDHAEKIKQQTKKYYIDHADKLKENSKKFRAENVDKCKEYNKKYHTEHTEELKELYKKYRSEHLEELKEYKKKYRAEHSDKFICECGGKYLQLNKLRHFKSQKHLNYTKGKPN